MPEDKTSSSGRWEGRPVASWLLRASVFVVPILASIGTSLWLSKVLPTPTSPVHLIGWWVLILACSTSVLFLVDKGSRKLLPLAALMQISMIFPDKAPKRFKTALKSGSSVKNLKEQLRRAEAGELGDDMTEVTQFILQMATALNTHDPRTRGHAERVRAYSDMLAEEMNIDEEDRAKLRWASLLHDIGKLKIPTEILNKPGQLDDAEWDEIKKHPTYGAELAAPLLEWLGPWAATIQDHHERFDGNGYPAGKKGDEISFGGRIVNVSDAYDVMTTVRSYKKPMTTAAAREELARHAGAQFDPDVVRAFLNISMGRLRWVAGPLSWLAQMPFLNFLGAVQQVGTAVGVAGLATAATAGIVGAGVLDIPDEPVAPVPVVEVVPDPIVVVAAAPDTATVDEDGSSSIAVLSNDQVRSGTVVSIVEDPDFGRVVLNADGTVTYTPRADFSGPDSFTYALVDSGEVSGTAVVTVTVIEVNDEPTAERDTATLDEDGSIDIDVLANDSDPEDRLDAGSLRVVTAPLNGTAVVGISGSITYTPDPDFSGTDAFVYAVDDRDGATATATVEVVVTPVNDAPIIVADSATTNEDVAVTIAVADNDSDIDGLLDLPSLTVISAPSDGAAVPFGGDIVYTPDPDISGSDSFSYRLCDDGGACGIASVSVAVAAVNDPPVVPGPGPISTNEETTVTIDLMTGATDIDGGPLFAIVPATSDNGAVLVDNGDGTADYTPALDFFGADSFTYNVSDGAALTSVAVDVTVVDVNDPPTAPGPGPLVTDEDTMVSFDPVVGATDPDGDPVTLSSFDAVSAMGGTIAVGSLEYTPPVDYNGVDTFDYVVTDGRGEFVPVTVTITVAAVNDAPVAVADSYSVAEDTVLSTAAPGVLGNDTDVDLDPLTATVATPPLHGGVVVNLDGSFTYTPDFNFNGDDSFTYTANDGAGGWDTASVGVTVTPVNDAPVANDDGGVGFTLAEDAATFTTANVVTANDTDVEDTTPAATTTALFSPLSPAAAGTLVNNSDGTFDFTPALNWTGSASFAYTVDDSDGATSNAATVTLTVTAVNDDPVANDDGGAGFTTAEDTPFTTANVVTINDTDVEDVTPVATTTTITVPLAPVGAGTLVNNGNGSFDFAPAPEWSGLATFSYTVDDSAGATSNVAVVTITVTPVNDVPVAKDDSFSTDRGAGLVVAAPGVMSNDYDLDSDPLTALVVAGPTSGGSTVLVLSPNGSFTYTPDPGFVGVDTFTYRVWDGTVFSPAATVSITVDDGVVELSYYMGSGVHSPNISFFTPAVPPAIPLPDYDFDGNPGRTIATGGNATSSDPTEYHEWALMSGVSGLDLQGPTTLTLWSSAADFDINDDVHPEWWIQDCDATGTVCTDLVNSDLHVDEWNGGTAAFVSRTIDLGHLDTTILPGRMLKIRLVVNHNDLWVAYGTAAYPSGIDLTFANRPPEAVDDNPPAIFEGASAAISAAANDTDLNLDVDSIINITDPISGTAAARTDGSGIIDYTPGSDWNGTDSFTYDICDTSAICSTSPATVTITVTAINDEPDFTDGGDQSAWEDSGTTTIPDWASAFDFGPPDEDLSQKVEDFIIVSNSNPGLFSTLPDVQNDGDLVFRPAADANGSAIIEVAMQDDGGVVNAGDDDTSPVHTFALTINAINDEPSFSKGGDQTVAEDAGAQTVVGWATAISTGPPNEAAQSKTFNVVANTNAALFSAGPLVGSTGTLQYAPAPNASGSATITIELQDGGGVVNPGDDDTSSTENFKITVTAVNDPPVAVNDAYPAILEGGSFTTVNGVDDVDFNDTDIEDTKPTGNVTLVAGPANHSGAFVLNSNGTFTYTHDGSETTSDSFTYTVKDSGGLDSNVGTVTLTITPVNDAPVAVDDDGADTFWEPFFNLPVFAPAVTIPAAALTDNDSDAEGDPFSIVPAAGATTSGSTFSCVALGCTYTPAAVTGPDTFTYRIDDGTDVSAEATVRIDITPNSAGLVLSVGGPTVPNPAPLGGNVTYEYAAVNLSGVGAGGVKFQAFYPAGTSFVSAVSSAGVCSDQGTTVVCSLGAMPVGLLETVTVVLRLDSGSGSFSFTPWIVSSSIGDPDPTTNYWTEVVGIL